MSSTSATSLPLRVPSSIAMRTLAGGRLPLAADLPHLLQGPDAAFIAGASGLDALTNPGLFLCQLLVEQRVLSLLGNQRGLLAFEERRVVARPIEEPAAIDFEDPRGQLAEEHAVVRDEHQRGVPAVQKVFQPGDGVHVQMVRRFIQQQQVGRRDERPRQQHTPLHAGRQDVDLGVAIQAHARQNLSDTLLCSPRPFVVLRQRVPGPGQRRQRPCLRSPRHVLRQECDLRPRGHHDLAVVRFDLPRQNPQQRRLARSVATQQTDPLARFDMARDAVEQRRSAEGDTELIDRDNGHERVTQPLFMATDSPAIGTQQCTAYTIRRRLPADGGLKR